jgi:hypothetical protein
VGNVRALIERIEAGLDDAVRVVRVDGAAVRAERDVEFALGGHHWRYEWIPYDEVWIERGVEDAADRAATVVHELAERVLMRDMAMGYDAAHAVASAVEQALRKGIEHAG